MEYFLLNPKTKSTEGPYSLEMLRELVRTGKLLPDSLLSPPGGSDWIQACEVDDLFTPAPVPSTNTENAKDDFIHPLSKKGILQQQKHVLMSKGFSCISTGILMLFSLIPIYYFFNGMKGLLGAFGGKTTSYSFYILPCFIIFCSGVLISLGIYLRKKGKQIKIE
jgi:hypothetical protein